MHVRSPESFMPLQIQWNKYLAGGQRLILLLNRASKFLILFALVVSVELVAFVQIQTGFVKENYDLDQSWFLDLGYQLQQGHLLGRDTFFTYGPLAQVLVSTAAFWQGSGSILNALSFGYFLFTSLALILLALCLGLIKEIRWTGALFIFLVMFSLNFINLIMVRPLLVLLSVILLVRALTDVAAYRRGWAMATGGLCFAGLLFSADTGFFALASAVGLLLVCLALSLPWFERWGLPAGLLPRRAYLETFGVAGATFGLGLVALEIFFQLSSPTYQALDYLRYNLAILLRYNYVMGWPWMQSVPLASVLSLLIFLTLVYTVSIVLVSAFRSLQAGKRDRFHLLLGGLIAAGLTFKSALVRSELPHIAIGMAIFIFLFGLSLTFMRQARFSQLAGGSLLILFLMIWPYTQSLESFLILPEIASGRVSLAEKWQHIRSIQVDPQIIASPPLRAAVDSQKIIVDFPYQNVLAMALGQKSLAPVLQAYAAFDEPLQQNYVAVLARSQPDLEVIYGIDPLGAWPVDGVQNVTRVPIIFKYLVENFKLKTTEVFNNYVVLEPRPSPQPLLITSLAYTQTPIDQGFELRLSQPALCSLAELELLIRYPITSLVGRPTGLTVQAWNAENELFQTRLVAIETGRSFSTFFYLGRSESFQGLFDDQGRIETRTPFDRLTLRRPAATLFDVYPSQVQVSALRCVQPATSVE